MIRSVLASLKAHRERRGLTEAAKAEERRDGTGLSPTDPGIDKSVEAAIRWLLLAQAKSTSRDHGVSRHFSMVHGWGPSYPETTGYIVPTLIDWGAKREDEETLAAARAMTDWLVSIQFPDGGFQGGVVGAQPHVPVTFNTGQILIGLAAAAKAWGEPYLTAMNQAARWLVDTLDDDGCWRSYPTPFAQRGEKAYETHVAWGLIEAERVQPSKGYAEAARANIRWAIGRQRENGWVENCCLTDNSAPLTHTLGYFLRGVIEGHRFERDPSLLEAAERTARGTLKALGAEGYLPGRLDKDWQARVPWVCLTGSVQTAHCFLMLFQETRDQQYRDAGYALNRYVRRSVRTQGEESVRGGVKGSFPVSGDYGKYEYLNWAAKFFIDSNLLEASIRSES